jgi:hypothetical protein
VSGCWAVRAPRPQRCSARRSVSRNRTGTTAASWADTPRHGLLGRFSASWGRLIARDAPRTVGARAVPLLKAWLTARWPRISGTCSAAPPACRRDRTRVARVAAAVEAATRT